MSCTYHPNANAKVHCSVCKTPLCAQCANPEGDDTFLCDRCAMRATIQAMGERRQGKIEDKKLATIEKKARRKKQTNFRKLIPVTVGIVIAIVELFFYFRLSTNESERFNPHQDPAPVGVVIDQAIREFSQDHGGEVPQRLENLLGKYLPPDRIGPGALQEFYYTKRSTYSYELWPNGNGKDPMSNFVFTEDGLELEDSV